MAYRQFRNELTYDAPDIDLFPKTLSILQQAAQQRREQQRQDRAMAANFQADVESSKFTRDAEVFGHLAMETTRKGVEAYKNYGQPTPEVKQDIVRHKMYANQSAAQFDRYTKIREDLKNTKWLGPDGKNYFIADNAISKWDDANYNLPDKHEMPWVERERQQNEVIPHLKEDILNDFNHTDYLTNWVHDYEATTTGSRVKDASGAISESRQKAIFRNEKGVPEVTDKIANEFLTSSPYVNKFYGAKVDTELLDDAVKIQSNPKEYGELATTLAALDPEQKVQFLREPGNNPISKMTPAERQLKIAKEDLEKRQRISVNNVTDYSVRDEGWKNKARGITSDKYDVDEGHFDGGPDGGIGQGFRNTKSQTGNLGPIVNITMPFDKTNKRMLGNNKGTIPTYVQGWNVGLSKGGQQIDVPGNTPAEKIKYLQSQPESFWNGVDVGPILQGKSINKKDIDDARTQLTALNIKGSSLTEAERAKKETLSNTLKQYDLGEIGPEVITAVLGTAINEVSKPLPIYKPGERLTPEASQLKKAFGEYDVTDMKNWGDDAINYYNKINEIKNKKPPMYPKATRERKTGVKEGASSRSGNASTTEVKKITPDEFSAKWATLKPGETLMAPDGNSYTKK